MKNENFKKVSIDECAPLRTEILRPHFPAGKLLIRDMDRLPTTHHFGIFDAIDQELVGCVTYAQNRCKKSPAEPAIQLTAMAVATHAQRKGVGLQLVEKSLDELPSLYPGPHVLWCNAREYAVPFYAKLSFQCWGERFDIKDVGPHFIMWRIL